MKTKVAARASEELEFWNDTTCHHNGPVARLGNTEPWLTVVAWEGERERDREQEREKKERKTELPGGFITTSFGGRASRLPFKVKRR